MGFDIDTILVALLLTLVAGMATGVGALAAFFAKGTSPRLLSGALGLSAGVMVYVSFMDLLPEAFTEIGSLMSERSGKLVVISSFFAGVLLIALIDWLIPEDENPHEMRDPEERADGGGRSGHSHAMKRTGLMVGTAIAVHNFPEGVATFVAALDGMEVAIPIVVAIAIHNIPEGVAVAVPVYHSTGSRSKALRWSLLAGLAEPAGALVAMLVLLPLWTPVFSSVLLAAVSGVMVYISIDELLPAAQRYGHHHASIAGFVAGMALMALSLLFL